MKFLEISSIGVIDSRAFTLLGNSTKTGDNSKIGMYGSGLKYAIASLMRNDILFRVYSGPEEIKFTNQKTSFRDRDFDVIMVNGQETSLTTNLGGEDWDKAFAPIREIYSNALDEDEDATLKITNDPKPIIGKTVFYIELNNAIKHFYDNVHLYFCNRNPNVLFSGDHGSIYNSFDEEARLFRRGILCMHTDTKKQPKGFTNFNYNSNFKINESRVLSDFPDARFKVAAIWRECNDFNLISKLIMQLSGGNAGTFEHELSWEDTWSRTVPKFSEAWKLFASKNKFCSIEIASLYEPHELEGRLMLQYGLIEALRHEFPDMDVLGTKSSTNDEFVEFVPKEHFVNNVIDALSILRKAKFLEEDIVVKYVKFTNSRLSALGNNDDFLLSKKLENKSASDLAKKIMYLKLRLDFLNSNIDNTMLDSLIDLHYIVITNNISINEQ